MRRAPTTLLVAFLVAVAAGLVGVLLALVLLARPAGAAELPVLPRWQPGPRPATISEPVTWWAEGLPAPPVVAIEGGQGGLSSCSDDGAGALRCVLWAQGAWSRIAADGELVAERVRLALPMTGNRSP